MGRRDGLTRDPNLISLGRRPRPTGRAVPLTPATRVEIDRFEDSLRIAAGFRVVCPPVCHPRNEDTHGSRTETQ